MYLGRSVISNVRRSCIYQHQTVGCIFPFFWYRCLHVVCHVVCQRRCSSESWLHPARPCVKPILPLHWMSKFRWRIWRHGYRMKQFKCTFLHIFWSVPDKICALGRSSKEPTTSHKYLAAPFALVPTTVIEKTIVVPGAITGKMKQAVPLSLGMKILHIPFRLKRTSSLCSVKYRIPTTSRMRGSRGTLWFQHAQNPL